MSFFGPLGVSIYRADRREAAEARLSALFVGVRRGLLPDIPP